MTDDAPAAPQRLRKILFLISSLAGTGAQRAATVVASGWAACGHSVTMLAVTPQPGNVHHAVDPRVTLTDLFDGQDRSQRRGARAEAERLWRLRKHIRALAPDVVVAFQLTTNLRGLLASWGLGVPLIVCERTYPPLMPIGKHADWLRRRLYPRADAVVMQTETGAAWLREYAPKARPWAIPNPIQLPLPRVAPILDPADWVAPSRKLVTALGRLRPEKGYERLIAAFAQVAGRYPDWDLAILGRGNYGPVLEAERDHWNLDGRVIFPGRAGNPADWYARSDLYVVSSHFEGFPNALLEAMAHGLPAISFDIDTGPRDIIRPEQDGLLVPPADGATGLATALDRLMADAGERTRMGQNARAVRTRFDVATVLAEWDKLLASVC